MKTLLAFKTIYVDSLSFPEGMTIHAGDTFKAYDANYPEEEEIITEKKKKEEELIKWFLNSAGKELLLEELNVGSNPFVDHSVRRPVIENTQEKPGDVDILICEGHRPENAIAFQCKAVGVTAFNRDEDDVNKIPDIKDGVLQANKQREKLGFYKNYLAIIIKAYGRKRTENNVLFSGPSQETLKRIYEFPQRESLHSDVGIIFLEIVQPTGKSYNKMIQIGICIDKEASMLSQTPSLTNRIKEYMHMKRAI